MKDTPHQRVIAGLDLGGWPLPHGIPMNLGNWRRVDVAVSHVALECVFFANKLLLRASKAFLANTPVGHVFKVEKLWIIQRRKDGWYVDDVADPYDDATVMRAATRHGR